MLNKVILVGNLGQNAEIKTTRAGKPFAILNLATKDRRGQEEQTDWHRVIYWGGAGVHPYLTKGALIWVEGKIQTRNYQDQSGQQRYITEIVAFRLGLLGGRKREESPQQEMYPEPAPPSGGDSFGESSSFGGGTYNPGDDDIPF
jgi:single-strand DNA-binding protein